MFSLIKNFIELIKIIKKQQCIKRECEIQIFNILLEITGKLGDLLVCINTLEIPFVLFGRSLNEGALGLGGFTSAIIDIYRILK